MDMAQTIFQMETHIQDNIDMENLGEKGNIFGQQEQYTRVNLQKVKRMDMEDGKRNNK